jgi:hypothetical protein
MILSAMAETLKGSLQESALSVREARTDPELTLPCRLLTR